MINVLYCSEMSKRQSYEKDKSEDLVDFHNPFWKMMIQLN